MCGIAGGIWFDPASALDEDSLHRMTRALEHRGPDDEGYFRSTFDLPGELDSEGRSRRGGVALGHRRLSIIDLEGGHQPLSNEDGSVWVTFNGEIYNYRELRRRLEGAGHRLRSESDTETLVHLYEDEGLDFLARLDGMFALALWDSRRRRLVLARDRLGKKPLVYTHDRRRLLFASELKSLLAAPGIGRAVDPTAIDAFLMYQYVPHPRTILAGVSKLPPAHWAVVEPGSFRIGCYWRPDFSREIDLSDAEAVDAVRAGLEDSVRARMRSDVPLGAFLSGGVDSTLVAGLMRRRHRPRSAPSPLALPTRATTKVAGRDWRRSRSAPNTTTCKLISMPRICSRGSSPRLTSRLAIARRCRRCAWPDSREHVKVALTGDGGDELFIGYLRYLAVQWAERADRLPTPGRRLLTSRWFRAPPRADRSAVAPAAGALCRGARPKRLPALCRMDQRVSLRALRRALQR